MALAPSAPLAGSPSDPRWKVAINVTWSPTLPQRASVGAKRNLACAEARGELIAHWDDDDWYAPARLSWQAAPIVVGRADLTGLQNRFILQLPAGAFWTIRRELHQRTFVGDVHGGTLMFRRSVFAEGLRYPEVNLAEDAAFLRDAMHRGRRLVRLDNPGVFVYVRHGRNALVVRDRPLPSTRTGGRRSPGRPAAG